MIGDYYNHLTAPIDDMYDEGILPSCKYYQIEKNAKTLGFMAINDENVIMQFYLKEELKERADSIFDEIIKIKGVEKAISYSNDPLYHEQCMRKAVSVSNHGFMFCEAESVVKDEPFEGILMELPEIDSLDEILSHYEGIGMDGDWVKYYLTTRIETMSLFIFRHRGMIIGSGEMRPSISFPEYANVGMSVSADYRKRGLGSFILSTMRNRGNEKGLKVICSTDHENIASYNTIIKSGFTCYHKIEEISFK